MTKFSRFLTTSAFALCALPIWANEFSPGWTLDREASNIRFQSVKNSTVVESSTFATYSGTIGEDGTAELTIMLESVDTKVDLRNVRMRFLFFETFRYPEAKITAQLSPDMISDLKQVRRKTITLPFSLDLHGIKKTLVTEVVATLLSDNRVSIATTAPISIAAADFDLSENIGKLEDAAGVTIIPSATVTFDFLFDRSGTGAAPSGGGATQAEPEVVNVALEPEGNLDLQACEGRFEILSRTGNIYFRSGSARLDAESRPLLTEVVDIVTRCPQLDIEIAGHTDSDGPASSNERLSEARARSVADFLINAGVPRDRLTARGYGESRPVAENTTREGKSKNRRIEFLSQAN